ncbi:acyl carrier protein [Chryseobacterium joostei]|uniref:Acyl carrier protein n=1 Tax=Chryseobacterium joostei TaxID=112234 RepID=A0A1N7I3S6_9FLAO|nr:MULTISPECIES: acyl carrier protein [Chryseobacterium]AZA99826.1 acyl carrier protein [Chryseobacterium joostei]SIS31704.1 Phosphopantetheine attachment site [Chryseobacterium joostei]HCM33527.1 acyl carrier protein [Chryseobacterium sp.]
MKSQIIDILNGIRPEFDFGTETNFISQGMLDSFDLITLVTELDESFGISIDGTDILPENFESVDSIEALIKKNGVQ